MKRLYVFVALAFFVAPFAWAQTGDEKYSIHWDVVMPSWDGECLKVEEDERVILWFQMLDGEGHIVKMNYAAIRLVGEFEFGSPQELTEIESMPGAEGSNTIQFRLADFKQQLKALDLPSYGEYYLPETKFYIQMEKIHYENANGEVIAFPDREEDYFGFILK